MNACTHAHMPARVHKSVCAQVCTRECMCAQARVCAPDTPPCTARGKTCSNRPCYGTCISFLVSYCRLCRPPFAPTSACLCACASRINAVARTVGQHATVGQGTVGAAQAFKDRSYALQGGQRLCKRKQSATVGFGANVHNLRMVR